jgi:malonate transporter and related proteins
VPETLNIVVSIFGLIGLGYLAARTALLSSDVGERLAEFVFTLAIPLFIFATLARADLHGVSPWRIWASYFLPFAIVWVVSHLMVVRLFGRDSRAGIVAGGSAAYGNSVLIGIPLVQTAFGENGMVFLIVVVLAHLPVLMVVSVVLNEWVLAANEEGNRPPRGDAWRRLVLSLVTHPILIAIALGILWRLTGFAIPGAAAAIIDPLARSAGPLALFSSGMTLVNYGMARQIGPAFAISGLKLLLMPALVLAAASAVGLPPIGIAAITLAAACPTGVNAPLIAIHLGTGQALASNVLLISTAGGVMTVSLWLMVIQALLL